MPAAKLLIPMASAATLFMAYNSASHDDTATNLCEELQCLATPMLVDTTPPDVLFLLDEQPAQSESVCTCKLFMCTSLDSSSMLQTLDHLGHTCAKYLLHQIWSWNRLIANSLTNVPCTRATLCGRLFDLSQSMRCHDVSRAQNCDTKNSHKTEREERQLNKRLSAHQSATSATQDLNRFSILCDSQKHTTCLDTHHSSMDQNQRNERDEDLLFVCLSPLLCPSSPSSATHDHSHGDMGITLEAHVCSREFT